MRELHKFATHKSTLPSNLLKTEPPNPNLLFSNFKGAIKGLENTFSSHVNRYSSISKLRENGAQLSYRIGYRNAEKNNKVLDRRRTFSRSTEFFLQSVEDDCICFWIIHLMTSSLYMLAQQFLRII